MTDFTHMSSVSVQGSVYSSSQGKLIGSFDTMPAASALNSGQIVLYTGPTGTYVKGTYYVSNGTSWSKSDATPERVTVDSELSASSSNPIQNSTVYSALNGKLGKSETAAKATADANGNNIASTYLTQNAASSTYATKTELSAYATQGDLTSAISSVYRYHGSVANFSDLPSGATVGDVYNVENSNGNVPPGTNWAWNGTSWDALAGSVDLSGYVPTSRKVNNKALTGDITLSAADVGAVSTTGTAARATADANGANIANTYATIQTVNGKQDKLTATGSATKPIYIDSNGVPTAISYTLADACAKSVTDTVIQNSTALITSGAVYSGLANKQNKLSATGSATTPVYINSSGVPAACSSSLGTAASKGVTTSVASGSTDLVTSGAVYSAINTGVPASGSYDADTSTITFKAASGAQLFQVTGIEGGGVQFILQVTYSGAPDLSGISVTATPVAGATATVQGTTNSSGVAYLSVKQNATYKITSSKSGYAFTSEPEVSCTDLTTATAISCCVLGTFTVTVTDEKASVVGRTVTATASGQTTQTKTVASGQTSVTFSLPAGTWTFKSDYPSGATGSTSITQVVENNGIYSGTISIVYIRVFGYILTKSQSDPSKKVSYPETIFGYTNVAASVAKATAVGSPGGWASVQDTLITGIVDETFNGDAMVYVQDSWYKRKEKDSSGNEYVAFASTLPDKEPSKWEDRAGSVDGVRIGHFRIGKYLTSSNNRSVSGSTPQVSTSITNFISYAQDRTYDGHPYDIMTKDQYEYFVDLLPMIFGTTNLQTIMRGYVDGHSAVATSAVLSEDALGMAGSASDGRMSALHVNDLWGNAYQYVGGARTDDSCNLWVRNGLSAVSDPTTANGWEKACDAVLVKTGGYIDDVAGTNKAGNFPISKGGSSSTHFADHSRVSASNFPRVGGGYSDGDRAGPFYEAFNFSAAGASSSVGSRISYRY